MRHAPYTRFRSCTKFVTASALVSSGVFSLASGQATSGPGRTLLPGGTYYPRLLRLAHGSAADNGRLLASTDGIIFQSSDDGRTFTKISTVPTAPGSKHVCCSTLYEVPRTVGSLRAGTLLSAGTYALSKDGASTPNVNGTDFTTAEPAIEIYASNDAGHTWTYLSTPVSGGPKEPSAKPAKQRGLWEPEFTLAADGALVMFVSDETDPCCSQKLIRLRTYDGTIWRDKSDVIRSPDPVGRPGMIVTTPLPNGRYFLTYEFCGAGQGCTAYSRSSADGWDFGDPTSPGTKVVSTTGQYFQHSPGNTFAPAPASGVVASIDPKALPRQATPAVNTSNIRRALNLDDTGTDSGSAALRTTISANGGLGRAPGELLLIGQILREANGSVSSQNGRVFFTNTNLDGTGPWTLHASPVPVPTAYDNFCPNYSSALLPVANGADVLELASDYDAAHRCVTYVGASHLR